MLIVRLGLKAIRNATYSELQRVISARTFSQHFPLRNQAVEHQEAESEEPLTENTKSREIDPRSDRSKLIPVETSIQYLKSDAYEITYGNEPVWKQYRRNFKCQVPPRKTRKTCIRNQALATGNPCPICRDEYLVLDYRNISLIQQFISQYNGQVISYQKTGLCQRQHQNLLVAIHKAKEFGTISFDVPFREYDYSEWYKTENDSKHEE